MAEKWIYYFGEATIQQKGLVGGKGAGLSEMIRLRFPVPTGFTITTSCCNAYQVEKKWPVGLQEEMDANIKQMEEKTGRIFGDVNNPLLVSVRSGAKISMPGMMDTVLNLGLNPATVEALGKKYGERFAQDCYRRFIQMFGDVVMGVEHKLFEAEIEVIKEKRGVKLDIELTADDLKELVARYLIVVKESTNQDLPEDPRAQLDASINAVFGSWMNQRAITYRDLEGIPHDLGTAVNIQEMVYGNMGEGCATGVGFTRDPATGEKRRFGEYLPDAQGEDVVAGIRTPKTFEELAQEMPKCYEELTNFFELMEDHFKDMQDVEFTIQNGKLYILQTRNGKRTARAALRMAVEMVHEGLISKETALLRLEASQMDQLMHPQFNPTALKEAKDVANGLPASPGAAVGQIVFSAGVAQTEQKEGKDVILVRLETSPEDIGGMAVSKGILTARGGMTSHAAVVARGMNIPCVAGCSGVVIDSKAKTLVCGESKFKEFDIVSLDGSTGKVYPGAIPVVPAQVAGEFEEFLSWTDEFTRLEVLTNADTPELAQQAIGYGAKGVGLCRTEHMFFNIDEPDRILHVREMICAVDEKGRALALSKLLPVQQRDFKGILGAMTGKPVVIRLIDPPLHEFLPQEHDVENVASEMKISPKILNEKIVSLHEQNPMLGFRGCRLGIVYPEINEMQVRAVFQASLECVAEGLNPQPWIEVPLVGNVLEYLPLKKMVLKVAKETGAEGKVEYKVGTMIEVPRAALTADELAPECDFFSFGTNDLTQMTCGFSRDDSGSFLPTYVQDKIYKKAPFEAIDQEGVGKLMEMCVKLGRSVKPDLDIGICGEHGGEPTSVAFCHKIGLNSVSCSPPRVPIARLVAAQSNLLDKGFTAH